MSKDAASERTLHVKQPKRPCISNDPACALSLFRARCVCACVKWVLGQMTLHMLFLSFSFALLGCMWVCVGACACFVRWLWQGMTCIYKGMTCIYIAIYIHAYMYIYIYTHIFIYVYTYVYMYVLVIYMYMYMYTCICTQTYRNAHMYLHTCHIYACAYIYIHTLVYTYTVIRVLGEATLGYEQVRVFIPQWALHQHLNILTHICLHIYIAVEFRARKNSCYHSAVDFINIYIWLLIYVSGDFKSGETACDDTVVDLTSRCMLTDICVRICIC